MSASGSPGLLIVLGPTGTGKSAAAVLAAEALGGEIVGCDALQVYRGLDAGTAKPTPAERRRVPHHLVDCVDPRQDFSMADYVRAAEDAIAGIARRARVPIVVGGNGLYLRALLRGFIEAPARHGALRQRLLAEAAERGTGELHRQLAELDPRSAARVAPGDRQRIVRGLELALAGGASWSERLAAEGTWASGHERYGSVKVGLDLARPALEERLASRVARFFAAGLVDEVRGLLDAGVPASANAFKAIGYRQVCAALASGGDPGAVRDEVERETRRYAKRQRTWFRKEPGVAWVDAGPGPAEVAARIVARWRDVPEGA